MIKAASTPLRASVRFTTAVGFFALSSNGSSNNTAFGSAALGDNTNGSDNTASGYRALLNNQGGNQNTALGSGTLENNVSGNQNVAVGQAALANSTVSSNTAVGWEALSSDTRVPTTRLWDFRPLPSTKLGRAATDGEIDARALDKPDSPHLLIPQMKAHYSGRVIAELLPPGQVRADPSLPLGLVQLSRRGFVTLSAYLRHSSV